MSEVTRAIMAQVLADVFGPNAADSAEEFATAIDEPIEFVHALIAVGVLVPDPSGPRTRAL